MSVAFCVAVRGCGRGGGTKTAIQNAMLTLVWNDMSSSQVPWGFNEVSKVQALYEIILALRAHNLC